MGKNGYRKALEQIADIAVRSTADSDTVETGDDVAGDGCRVLALPGRLQERAAAVASIVNPVNAPLAQVGGLVDAPQRLTLLTSKYWGPSPRKLSVSFMENPQVDLRRRIVQHMNAWSSRVSISFHETNGVGDVRISLGPGGYYSYLGTDIKLIPKNRQTMNLQGFTMNTPESEYRRVVRHETGHTLGFPHEHMRKALVARIVPEKAYVWFWNSYGWDKATVDAQVLTPLASNLIQGTAADQDSIMCYQLPGQITVDGQPIRGGLDINERDYAFAEKIYPKVGQTPDGATTASDVDATFEAMTMDWDPADDPELDVEISV